VYVFCNNSGQTVVRFFANGNPVIVSIMEYITPSDITWSKQDRQCMCNI